MNKDNAKEYLPLVQALAEGKVIQSKFADGWEDLDVVSFDLAARCYRIKHEPREIWVNTYPGGDRYLHDSAEDAASYADVNVATRHYREVIE